jgi:hypothetical protein
VRRQVGAAHIVRKSFAVYDARAEQEAADEHVEPFHEHLANTRRAEQPQRHGKVLPWPGEVSRMNRPDTRSGCATAHDSPIGPPQSWATTTALRRSSDSSSASRGATWRGIGRALDRSACPTGRTRGGRHDHTVIPIRQRADEVPVQEAPGRVAVHEYDGAAVPRALVDAVHLPVGRRKPARLKRPQSPESPVVVTVGSNPRRRAEGIKDTPGGRDLPERQGPRHSMDVTLPTMLLSDVDSGLLAGH